MTDELNEVVVKESVYKALDLSGIDVLKWLAVPDNCVIDSKVQGSVVYLSDQGEIPAGSFEVALRSGQDFPEAGRAHLCLNKSVIKLYIKEKEEEEQ